MNEVKLLLERAESKLSAAKMLLSGRYFDDAVSRAYYSMHFAARALLLTKDIATKTHKGLISKFGLEFIDKGFIERTYGRALNTAKEDREEADYSITCEITEEETELVIKDADAFLERIVKAVNEITNKS